MNLAATTPNIMPTTGVAVPMEAIDPRDFGRLEAEVNGLRRDMDQSARAIEKMSRQLDDLTALANKSRGGLWAGMAIVSTASAGIGFLFDHWLR